MMSTASCTFIVMGIFFIAIVCAVILYVVELLNKAKKTFSTSSLCSHKAKANFNSLAEHYDVSVEYQNYITCGYEPEKAFDKALQLKRHTKETRKDTPAYEYTDGLIDKYPSLADMWNTLTSDEVKNIHFHRLQGYSFLLGSVTRNGDSATLHWVMKNKDKDIIDLFDTVEAL